MSETDIIQECRRELHRWHEGRAKTSSEYWFINAFEPRPENESLLANRGERRAMKFKRSR